MSSGPESEIEDFVMRRAEAKGFFTRKIRWPNRRAAPDTLFAREDRGTVWIEFKAPGEKADSHQAREHERMRKAGMEVHVCDNVNDAMRLLGLWP